MDLLRENILERGHKIRKRWRKEILFVLRVTQNSTESILIPTIAPSKRETYFSFHSHRRFNLD